MGENRGPGEREGFTGELWRSITGVYGSILEHPFLSGLSDGTLPKECFRHYVIQDSLYLREYARALSLAGARSPEDSALVMFNEHSAGAIAVEQSLHEGFMEELGLEREEVARTPLAPTTLAYTSYLQRVAALGDYYEALGAVLPCYWIYNEVGKALVGAGSPEPRYERWISTYAGPEFGELVEAVLDLTDRTCRDLDPARRERTLEAFAITSRYEWMFWDMGWTLEEWPVG